MKLFDDLSRTDQRPRLENEPIFDYLNSSGRSLVAGVRDLLELWFERYPEDAKNQLKRRLSSRENAQHKSAFFELYLHELLTSSFEVELEPDLVTGAQTHPDFKVKLAEQSLFYLEAVLATQSVAEAANDARVATVIEAINRINSPNFMLQVSYSGPPKNSPPTRHLRRQLERWLSGLNPDEVATIDVQTGYDKLPCYKWSHEEWRVEFRAIPIAPEFRGLGVASVIGSIMPSIPGAEIDLDSYVDRKHEAVREAVRRKATKYEQLGLPYVVAVNILEPFAEDRHLLDALFGEEQITVSLSASGSWSTRESRARDGAWIGPAGPHNTRVSAVLAGFNLTPLVSATRAPVLIHNPWASQPLPTDLWPLPQIVINLETGTLDRIDGKGPAELLRFPSPWPPTE
jgi:hypothetical protein